MAVRGHVGDRGAVELDALVERPSDVARGDHLGHDAAVDRDELAVDELHAGRDDLRRDLVGQRGVPRTGLGQRISAHRVPSQVMTCRTGPVLPESGSHVGSSA